MSTTPAEKRSEAFKIAKMASKSLFNLMECAEAERERILKNNMYAVGGINLVVMAMGNLSNTIMQYLRAQYPAEVPQNTSKEISQAEFITTIAALFHAVADEMISDMKKLTTETVDNPVDKIIN